ncbi:MAG: hypothetical protein F6K16_00060 [Symploca sp. SIO2B6]|nr:hypothetical protein [Symploca sp. SIO2B6]
MTDILEKIGSFTSTIGAEITAYDPQSQELFVVSGDTEVQVIDFSDPTNPTEAIPPIDISTIVSGIGGANSIAVSNGLVAVALEAQIATDPGSIVVVDIAAFRKNPADASTFKVLEVGALPDMLTFTPDGTKLLVANEAEPDDGIDPESSISIIDLSAGLANLSQDNVATADFTAFNGREEELRNKGVRIFPDKNVAEDVEPEFIAVSPDGKSAFVTLQENNAFAVLDLESAQVTDILPLGVKDHSQGQPTLETFEFTDLPLLGTTEAGQEIKLGGLSGLFYEGTDETTGKLKFITVPDRGPNGEPTDVDGDGSNERPFALPDYQARAIRFELEPNSGEISITETIFLTRPDGKTPITGRPNIEGIDEEPVDLSGNLLPLDEFGADLEGIVIASDGTFWMVDEYRPAIYHFDAQGVLIDRFVPEGISALAGKEAGTFGTESLPAEYSNRRRNRGFEAVSLDPETGILYAFIQTPLANPDRATSDNSDVIRILGIDTTTGSPVAEYVYLLEDSASGARPGGRVDKIGDATYAGDGKFFIIERDSAVGETAKKFIFEIDLKGATNLLDPEAPALPADITLEQLGNADQLAAVGIQAVNKIKVTNLPSIGYLAGDKPEGLALLDDGKLAVLNDNDFGLLDQEIPVDGSVPLNPNPTPVVLGIIDFDNNNSFDASDRDNAINIQNHPVFGLKQPDSIASFEANGKTYYVTANEGDARDEDERIKDLTLDPEAFPDAANLQQDEQLGRLQVSTIDGDLDGDGDFDQLFSYGGRSFSIYDEFGNLVFDSGNDLEQITAQQIPELFNSEGVIDEDDGFDSRSDNKGPEPEGITTGVINDRTYVFVGLERTGGIAAYEVTNPTAPQFVQYLPNDDGGDPTNPVDRAPEGLTFISAEDSPNGEPLLVVANEDSQTLSVLSVNPGTRISDIQGAGHTSPLEGQSVRAVPGIVTAIDSNGFYLQDPNPDNNEATSEGIFVFTGSAPTVSVGDQIEVSGTVSEFTPGGTATGNLSITQITSPEITVISSNNSLPASVILGAEGRTPPTEIVDNDNFAVFDPEEDGIDFYESLEGMRVTIDNPVAVSATNRFGEIWTVTDNGALVTPGLNSRGGIQLGPEDTNPERIQVQLDSGVLPDFEAAVNLGDTLSDVTGVVSYSFGNFEVTATEPFEITDGGLQAEVTSLVGSDDQLTIASYNVLNLDPSDTEQIAQIAEQITNNLQSPDILALQEIQDNSGSADDGVTASDQTLQALVDAIADAGGSNYQFFDVPPADGSSGGQPVGNIRVAYLYDPTRVSLDEQSIQSLDVPAFDGSRDPLVADFSFNDNTVTVINNHFSSRFGSSPIFGAIQPFIQAGEDERNAQAQFLNDFVDGIIAEDADANVVVLGDLNTFEFTDTLSTLAGEGDEQVLTNLVSTLDDDVANTFNFQGNSQVLDHAFVSNSLLEGAEFDIVNLNIDFAEQASDHDPIIARLNLPSDSSTLVGSGENEEIVAGAGNDTVAGGLGDDEIFGKDGDDVLRGDRNNRSPGSTVGGNDTIFGGAGNDRIGGKAGNDQLFGEEGDDQIWGDDGDDIIYGGFGNDTLTGDNFSGGKGSDTFVLALGEGTDTIVDFQIGEDLIALADSLSFGQLSITEDGGNTLIGFEEETLAILKGINANELTDTSFTVI